MAPITFFIFDFDIIRERVLIIVLNMIATTLLVLSEIVPTDSVIELSQGSIFFINTLSVISTIGSIFIVFYLYSANLSSIHRELNRLANTDSLTNTFNRRTLFKEGNSLFQLYRGNERAFSFMIMDIDHFKRINDVYGHPVGDQVLIEMTNLISKNIRYNDLLTRYGGEEFAVILKGTSRENNVRVALNIRKRVEENNFYISDGVTDKLTISVGVACCAKDFTSFEEMVKCADKALYRAKNEGRNRVLQGEF